MIKLTFSKLGLCLIGVSVFALGLQLWSACVTYRLHINDLTKEVTSLQASNKYLSYIASAQTKDIIDLHKHLPVTDQDKEVDLLTSKIMKSYYHKHNTLIPYSRVKRVVDFAVVVAPQFKIGGSKKERIATLLGVVAVESNFIVRTRGEKFQEIGLTQQMPREIAELRAELKRRGFKLVKDNFDPYVNLCLGALALELKIKQYGYSKGLARYNGVGKVTIIYRQKVLDWRDVIMG